MWGTCPVVTPVLASSFGVGAGRVERTYSTGALCRAGQAKSWKPSPDRKPRAPPAGRPRSMHAAASPVVRQGPPVSGTPRLANALQSASRHVSVGKT
jgi:hypothetical protein